MVLMLIVRLDQAATEASRGLAHKGNGLLIQAIRQTTLRPMGTLDHGGRLD
jgi:hypothetical protein